MSGAEYCYNCGSDSESIEFNDEAGIHGLCSLCREDADI